MNIRRNTSPASLCLCLCAWLAGCTTAPTAQFIPNSYVHTEIPPATPLFDHYSAWIPASRAPTATVAQAMVHVALGEARLQAGKQLCGSSLQPAQVMGSVGPLYIRAAPDLGDRAFWYYRVSQQPGMQGCTNVNLSDQYRALEDNLPAWIRLSPATDTPSAVGLLDPL